MSIKNIAVSLAGSVASLITAKYAICLAKELRAKLFLLYVVDERSLRDLLKMRVFVEIEAREYEEELLLQGKGLIERIRRMAESKGVTCEGLLLRGIIHEEVVSKTSELNADLLVIGELKEVLSVRDIVYSEGERIFREAACPVVVVKNPELVEKVYKEI